MRSHHRELRRLCRREDRLECNSASNNHRILDVLPSAQGPIDLPVPTSSQGSESGYLLCEIAQRRGVAKVWPSQKSRDTYPVPTCMGSPCPVHPESRGGAPSSVDPLLLGGSSRREARQLKALEDVGPVSLLSLIERVKILLAGQIDQHITVACQPCRAVACQPPSQSVQSVETGSSSSCLRGLLVKLNGPFSAENRHLVSVAMT